MFSGIIETCLPILGLRPRPGVLEMDLRRPSDFSDLEIGASVAVNGVCLTVEALTTDTVTFALTAETLHVTGWTADTLQGRVMNVERSLRFGDRVHGHLVTGHVDGTAEVVEHVQQGETTFLELKLPDAVKMFVWKKGCLAINGVSVTVNAVSKGRAQVCLVPETLKRTNLGFLEPGTQVNVEADYLARAFINRFQHERQEDVATEFNA